MHSGTGEVPDIGYWFNVYNEPYRILSWRYRCCLQVDVVTAFSRSLYHMIKANCFWRMDDMVRPVNFKNLSLLSYFLALKSRHHCIRYHGRALVCPSFRKCIGQGHQTCWKSQGLSPAPSPRSSWPDRKVKQLGESSGWPSLFVGYYGNYTPCVWLVDTTLWPQQCWDCIIPTEITVPVPSPDYWWITIEHFKDSVDVFNTLEKGVCFEPSQVMRLGRWVSRLHINDLFLHSHPSAPSDTFLYSSSSQLTTC